MIYYCIYRRRKKRKYVFDLKYATDDNFVGYRFYPKNMPLIVNKVVWKKLKNINNDKERIVIFAYFGSISSD